MSKTISAPKELLAAQKLANLYDTAIKIPVLNISVGLDFIIGLIPVVGDTVMLLLSLRIIYLGKRMGVPKPLLSRMWLNSLLDMVIGFIPILGDIIDVFFTANTRNVRIMERWWITENKSAVDAYTQKQLQEWDTRQENNL